MKDSNSFQSLKSLHRRERDEEFIRLYRAALELMISKGVRHPRRSAIRFAVANGHPRYHVSLDHAYATVCKVLREKHAPSRQSLKSLMWHEIAARVDALTRDRQLSVRVALEFVLDHCRATRFFITESYADSHLLNRRRAR